MTRFRGDKFKELRRESSGRPESNAAKQRRRRKLLDENWHEVEHTGRLAMNLLLQTAEGFKLLAPHMAREMRVRAGQLGSALDVAIGLPAWDLCTDCNALVPALEEHTAKHHKERTR